jgi:DNA-binding NarL/FixJ family response regulator
MRILKRRWPHIKVVILTLYSDCEVEARLAGADAVLLKGRSWEEMTSTLRSVAGA